MKSLAIQILLTALDALTCHNLWCLAWLSIIHWTTLTIIATSIISQIVLGRFNIEGKKERKQHGSTEPTFAPLKIAPTTMMGPNSPSSRVHWPNHQAAPESPATTTSRPCCQNFKKKTLLPATITNGQSFLACPGNELCILDPSGPAINCSLAECSNLRFSAVLSLTSFM